MARTKIIATLGPATGDRASIERLILLGVNVFRLNFSHGDHAFYERLIHDARSVAKELKCDRGQVLKYKNCFVRE